MHRSSCHRALWSLGRLLSVSSPRFAGGYPCCCGGGGSSSSGSSRRVVGAYSGSSGEHGCNYCSGFRGPYEWRVDIDGITNAACQSCDNWNATYYLTPSTNSACFPVTENTSCCCWTAPDGGDACAENQYPYLAGEYAQCTLQVCAAYDNFVAGIRVRMYHARTGGFFVFEKELATPIDCLGIADLDLPLIELPPSFCTITSATCRISALP